LDKDLPLHSQKPRKLSLLMTEPLINQKIKKPPQESSQNMQTLSKKIPRHRRQMHEIEAKEASYKRLSTRQNLSRRLKFIPFYFHRRGISISQEVNYIARIQAASAKITNTIVFSFDMTRGENDKMFLHYSEEIKKMRALKTLDFSFSSSQITDLAIQNMSMGFKSLRSLQYLRIRFVECDYIDDPSIIYVAKGLKKLTSLQTLDLSFDEDPIDDREKTDEGIKILVKNLKHLKNLQTLNLSFNSEGGIRFEEVGDVAKAVKGLKFMKNIKLIFSLAQEMGLEGIRNVSKMLEALPGLKTISLRLLDCRIKDEGLEVLMEGFRGKEHLKMIRLDLGR